MKDLLKTPMDESDLFLTLGSGSIFFGLYQIYPPIAYIVIGVIFIVIAWLQAPKPPKVVSEDK